jgi:hypothetical protein
MTDKTKKDKCEMLIKQIFGSNFYFVHGTSRHHTEPILKSGYISTSSEIDKKYWRWDEGFKYVYCWMKHDDTKVKLEGVYSDDNLLIDPRIILHEDIVFNSGWHEIVDHDEHHPDAIKKHKNLATGEEWTSYNFSIRLNKSDSAKERLDKLKRIKKYIRLLNKDTSDRKISYSHEFLFLKKINLKKYLIGIVFDRKLNIESQRDGDILKILQKKYKNLKIFEKTDDSQYYPKLMDVIW